MFVLDTNIIIQYLQGVPTVKEWINEKRSRGARFVISAVTVTELLSCPNTTPNEKELIELLLRELLVIDVSMTVARLAAHGRVVHRMKTIDSLIAATAESCNVPLVTRDTHFKKLRKPSVIFL